MVVYVIVSVMHGHKNIKFTTAYTRTLPPSPIIRQINPIRVHHPISLRSVSILSSNISLGLLSGLFPYPLYMPHVPVIALAFITSPDGQYKSGSPSLLNLLHVPVTAFLLVQTSSSAPHSRTQTRFHPPLWRTIFRIQLASIFQVFGFIFLYSKSKKNDSGPNGNKHSKAKQYMKVTLLGLPHSVQYCTMYPNRLHPPPQKKMFCSALFLCYGGSRVD